MRVEIVKFLPSKYPILGHFRGVWQISQTTS
nr:MAG TPA_asm: hypothetical protein [Bacteriophage sp.]DAY78559.1 MAG TPA: hypothetical protein [Caudoviricetes sp.]